MSFDVSLSWLKRKDAYPGQSGLDQGLIDEFNQLIGLLEQLRDRGEEPQGESVGLLIEHAILVCHSYLDVLHDEDRLEQMMNSTRKHERNLRTQLEASLQLLQSKTRFEYPAGAQFRSDDDVMTVVKGAQPPLQGRMQPVAATIDIYLLGKFRLFINGLEVARQLKGKAKLLLKYLVLHRQSAVPKEVLMDVFWPGYDADSARNNLNVAVYSLRQSLKKLLPDHSVILFSEGLYSLNPDLRIWTDVAEFNQLLKRIQQRDTQDSGGRCSLIEQAIGLYEGELLLEDPYVDWVREERDVLRHRYLNLLRDIDSYYQEAGDFESSIRINKKIIGCDPCEESAHRRLIENYQQIGQRHLAIRQYRVCADVLRKELDIEPSEDILDLVTDLTSQVGT